MKIPAFSPSSPLAFTHNFFVLTPNIIGWEVEGVQKCNLWAYSSQESTIECKISTIKMSNFQLNYFLQATTYTT